MADPYERYRAAIVRQLGEVFDLGEHSVKVGGDTMHDGCPIEAVFPADRFPCTFERGHDGPHSFIGLHVSP
jgi:hypothetical protein